MTQEELIEKAAELKPCPFCGGKAYLRTYGGTHSRPTDGASLVVIDCGLCVSKIERYGREHAVKAWNTRVLQPQLDAADRMRDSLYLANRMIHDIAMKVSEFGAQEFRVINAHIEAYDEAIAAYDAFKEGVEK